MRNENNIVLETQKTATISIEEYEVLQNASEALHGLKAENARLNQQVQWLFRIIKLSRKKLSGRIVGKEFCIRAAQLSVQ